jgi:hypothetical protein
MQYYSSNMLVVQATCVEPQTQELVYIELDWTQFPQLVEISVRVSGICYDQTGKLPRHRFEKLVGEAGLDQTCVHSSASALERTNKSSHYRSVTTL